MLIDLVQLRTFIAVAEEQHLTRAAERLHISQSAASSHVRAIEDSLDMQLFVRTNRRLELTRSGELLLRKANVLLSEAALFTSFARELRGKVQGKLFVGSTSEPGARIEDIIAALRARHPLVGVDLCSRPSLSTRQGLKTGELDIGSLLGRSTDPAFTYYELTTVQFRIAGPVAWKEQIHSANWGELASLPWLIPNSSTASQAMLAELFGNKGLELNTIVRFDNAALARAMSQAGIGIMVMREEHALFGERHGYLAVSPLARSELSLFIAHLESRKDDPLIQAFLEAAYVAWPKMKEIDMHEGC